MNPVPSLSTSTHSSVGGRNVTVVTTVYIQVRKHLMKKFLIFFHTNSRYPQ